MSSARPLAAGDELANRLRELVALPRALQAPRAVARFFRRGSRCGLEPAGGRIEFVRGGRGLAGRAHGVPCCPAQVPGRGVGLAARRASRGHRDLATGPGAGLPDRVPRPGFLRPGRFEQVQDVLRARSW